MKTLLAAAIGLALAAFANPAGAYVVEVTTSIPVPDAEDTTQLEDALRSAIDDVLNKAIAFTATVIVLTDARVIGDRIYLLLLIADEDGEKTMRALSAQRNPANRQPGPTERSTETPI